MCIRDSFYASRFSREEGEALVLMGHGSRHENNAVYARLQDIWNRMGCKDVFLGTVEASPDLEEVIKPVSYTHLDVYKRQFPALPG